MTVPRCWCCARDIGLRNATQVTLCERCRDDLFTLAETQIGHSARVVGPERRATVLPARQQMLLEARNLDCY